jgi:hypothetical protein
LNSLRVGKSFLFAWLLLPSLRRLQEHAPALAASRLAGGVATGLGLVVVAIIYERSAYPGLFDFSTAYRSTALFWEMHVGGAGFDGFLVAGSTVCGPVCVLRASDCAALGLLGALLAVGRRLCVSDDLLA